MKMNLVNERYETPEVATIEMLNEGVLCDSVDNGGIEGGIPDEL